MTETEKNTQTQPDEKIIPRVIEHEMKQFYLGYSMSVIAGRALPDVRDGLKPVHRRVLFSMAEMALWPNKPFKKSARIVGDVMGKYHPHGDSAIYDTMVRLAQDFSLRYPLVRGQGNFGSIDGDGAAAMRYTEAKLNKLSEEMLQDIDKDTVDFQPNYDGSLEEPVVLPSKAPNLLTNGSSGIAVGMATSIPPHNMVEVCEATIKVLDEPAIAPLDLIESVKGPDFPTGGIIMGTSGIKSAYATGKGKVTVRARAEVEETKKGKQRIIVTEIPYMVNKAQLIEAIAHLVRDKKVNGISDLRDESDRDGMRIVIELKSGANSDVVLSQLYKHSRMQDTFSINLLALDPDKQPKILNLKEIIEHFIDHRKEIVRRRTEFDLKKAEDRAHILEGLLIALDHIDDVVKLIKESSSVDDARNKLISNYSITEKQAQAILDMTLRRLTSLETEKLRNEHSDLLRLIADLKDILAHESKIIGLIKAELMELQEKYPEQRRTQVSLDEVGGTIDFEALVKPEDVVVTMSHNGYVKRIPLETYKQQRRGGRGIIAAETREDDFIEDLFVVNTHDHILYFTSKGKIYWLKAYQVPEAGRYAKGTAIVNMLRLDPEEKITAFIPVKEFEENKFLFMVTEQGTVKKTSLSNFSKPRKGGIIALGLSENDSLKQVLLTDGTKDVIIATENGNAVRFNEENVRAMGRTATGVIGIKLRNDRVIGATIADENKTLLTITSKGYGKRTPIKDYRRTSRGGVGVINIKSTEKNGKVVSIAAVKGDDGLMIISQNGVLIRTSAKGISVVGRNTQGVRVMRLKEDDKVISVAKIVEE